MSKVKDFILYYKKKIERNKKDEPLVIDSITKLAKLSVTPDLLKETEIFGLMRNLAFEKSDVGREAFPLYKKWKSFLLIASNDKGSTAENKPRSFTPPLKKTSTNDKTVLTKKENQPKKPTPNSCNPKAEPVIEDQNLGSQEPYHQYEDGSFNPHLSIEAPEVNGAEEAPEPSDSRGSRAGKVRPYSIEMKEGMFRVVKIKQEDPEIVKAQADFLRTISYLKKDRYGTLFSIDCNLQDRFFSKDSVPSKNCTPTPEVRKCDSPPSHLKFKKVTSEKSPSQNKSNIHSDVHQNNCDKKALDSAAIAVSTKRENRRAAVFSGRKNNQEIPSLKIHCARVLKKHIDLLRHFPPISYAVLKPVLEHLNASQLAKVEEHNKHLVPESDELWRRHCDRDYKGREPAPGGLWKHVYAQATLERQQRLKNVAASISASASKGKPDRMAKLVESPQGSKRRKASPGSPPKPHKKGAAPLMSKLKRSIGLPHR